MDTWWGILKRVLPTPAENLFVSIFGFSLFFWCVQFFCANFWSCSRHFYNLTTNRMQVLIQIFLRRSVSEWVSGSVIREFQNGDSYRISELVETHTHIPISIWWWSMLTITIHQAFPWQFSHRLNLKVVTLRSGLTIVPYPLPDPLWQLSWNFAPPAIADVALANFIDI